MLVLTVAGRPLPLALSSLIHYGLITTGFLVGLATLGAVGVAYGTEPGEVADVLLAVARAHPEVATAPAPIVLFRGFGDSALQFELRAWTGRFDRWLQTKSELTASGYAALRESGIEIPFPQREVRLRQA